MSMTIAFFRRWRMDTGAALAAVALLASACSGGSAQPGGTPTAPEARPSTPAKIEFLSPTNGDNVKGATAKVKLTLKGAKIVPQTTTNIRPDEGHVHLLLDGQIVSMNYGLDDTIAVKPGQHILRAEFVAADHRPFEPRVFTEVVFVAT
jgi:hypothetical protein